RLSLWLSQPPVQPAASRSRARSKSTPPSPALIASPLYAHTEPRFVGHVYVALNVGPVSITRSRPSIQSCSLAISHGWLLPTVGRGVQAGSPAGTSPLGIVESTPPGGTASLADQT